MALIRFSGLRQKSPAQGGGRQSSLDSTSEVHPIRFPAYNTLRPGNANWQKQETGKLSQNGFMYLLLRFPGRRNQVWRVKAPVSFHNAHFIDISMFCLECPSTPGVVKHFTMTFRGSSPQAGPQNTKL